MLKGKLKSKLKLKKKSIKVQNKKRATSGPLCPNIISKMTFAHHLLQSKVVRVKHHLNKTLSAFNAFTLFCFYYFFSSDSLFNRSLEYSFNCKKNLFSFHSASITVLTYAWEVTEKLKVSRLNRLWPKYRSCYLKWRAFKFCREPFKKKLNYMKLKKG